MKINDNSLYLVSSEEYSNGKSTLDIAKEAILGGVDIFQMREKHKSQEELLALGQDLSKLCSQNKVMFIVNDDPYLAKEVGADGVHLGQEDIKKHSMEKIRTLIGDEGVIGISTHTLDQFKEANEMDVDYVAFGPLFSTKTKDYFIGIDDVEEVLKVTKQPVVFIGGIDLFNVDSVLERGAKNIAVIRAITQARDIKERVQEFKSKIRGTV